MPILGYILVAVALLMPLQANAGESAGESFGDSAGESGFIGGGTDLPLMDGLEEVEGARVVFDKSAGRIIETILQGHVALADVQAFYVATLGQLGWEISEQHPAQIIFVREDERLIMDFESSDEGAKVRVLLGPAT